MLDSLNLFNDPQIKRYIENEEKLSQPPRINEIKGFKRLKNKDLADGYSHWRGTAHATRWRGSVKNVSLQKETIPVFKIRSDSDGWELIYEKGKGGAGGIITIDWSQESQGNFFQLQRHMDVAAEFLFGVCGFKSFSGRASPPRNDRHGVRGESDWRMKKTDWRKHRSTGEMIRIPRLMKMWLHCKWFAPLQMFFDDADEWGLMWLSPFGLRQLSDEQLQEMDDEIGSSKRRWKFSDAKCLH